MGNRSAWRLAGGATLLLAGLAVAGAVLWPRLDGGESPPRSPVRLVSVPELGLALAHPRDWRRTVAGRVIRLRSPDGTAVMTFASPRAGRAPEAVKAALVRELRRQLHPAEVLRDGPGRLAGRRVHSVELAGVAGRPPRRTRALALVDSTPYRTYAITLLTPARPSRRRIEQVSRILASVRLARPVEAPAPG